MSVDGSNLQYSFGGIFFSFLVNRSGGLMGLEKKAKYKRYIDKKTKYLT